MTANEYRPNPARYTSCSHIFVVAVLDAHSRLDIEASKIAEIRKKQAPSTNTRPRQWWRAKFYELDCLAKMPQRRKRAVLHAIEALKSSFTNIPALWAEKLNLLKQYCRNDDDNRQRL